MGIDLYAGPLSRYLMLDWETPAARFAREHNIHFKSVYKNLPQKFSMDDATSFTQTFRRRLVEKLGEFPSWQMDPSHPYDAWQLREGLGAVVLAAALRHRPELPLPMLLPADVQSHPAVSEASSRKYYLGPMAVFETHMIVPGVEPRICGDTNHRGEPIIIATTAALEDSVGEVCDFLEIDPNDLPRIAASGPPPIGPVRIIDSAGNWTENEEDQSSSSMLAHATWGLACFDAALRFSKETGAVIIRDE